MKRWSWWYCFVIIAGRFSPVAEMAFAMAVEVVNEQADDCPAEEQANGIQRQVGEQQQATKDSERANHPRERRAEWSGPVRLLDPQDHHAERHHHEGEQCAGVGDISQYADWEHRRKK